MRTTALPFLLLSVLFATPHAAQALNLANFIACVEDNNNTPYGSTCTLDNSSFTVSNSDLNITVGRAPLTINGAGSNSELKRASWLNSTPNYDRILIIPTTVSLIGGGPYDINVEDIRFNGNRDNQCRGASDCVDNPTPGDIDVWAQGFIDIEIQRTSQDVSVNLDNFTMLDAAGYGMLIRRGAYLSNNVDIRYSNFGDEGSDTGCAYLSCILVQVNSPSSASDLPYNLVALYNTFFGSGGGALSINNAVYPQIMANTFNNNHREFPHESGGGQIYLQYDATVDTNSALIYDNYLDGYDVEDVYGGVGGLELEGSLLTIELNYMVDHKDRGISMNGVRCAQVIDNEITSSGGAAYFTPAGMIQVIGHASKTKAEDIIFTGNEVHNNVGYGFHAWTGDYGVEDIEYSANTGNGSLFYSNSSGSVNPNANQSSGTKDYCGVLP